MKGSYRVIVQNAVLRFDFVIRRNITIIRGDSATGKTTLVEMVREYYESEMKHPPAVHEDQDAGRAFYLISQLHHPRHYASALCAVLHHLCKLIPIQLDPSDGIDRDRDGLADLL